MELKEGTLIRTKDGIIDEVIIDYKGYCNNPNCNHKHISCKSNYYVEDKVIKFSHNIIDLIEVGDYVNGEKVYYTGFVDDDSTGFYIDKDHRRIWLDKPSQIKSIVTKEQFSSMAYRLGE